MRGCCCWYNLKCNWDNLSRWWKKCIRAWTSRTFFNPPPSTFRNFRSIALLNCENPWKMLIFPFNYHIFAAKPFRSTYPDAERCKIDKKKVCVIINRFPFSPSALFECRQLELCDTSKFFALRSLRFRFIGFIHPVHFRIPPLHAPNSESGHDNPRAHLHRGDESKFSRISMLFPWLQRWKQLKTFRLFWTTNRPVNSITKAFKCTCWVGTWVFLLFFCSVFFLSSAPIATWKTRILRQLQRFFPTLHEIYKFLCIYQLHSDNL